MASSNTPIQDQRPRRRSFEYKELFRNLWPNRQWCTTQAGLTPLASSSTESLSVCPICFEAFSDRTEVQPCGHSFDRECIVRWWHGSLFTAKTCPTCRTIINGMVYTLQGAGSISTAAQENDIELAYQKECDRLLALPTRKRRRTVHFMDLCIREGEYYVHVTRSITLMIAQQGMKTISEVKRSLAIVYKHQNGGRGPFRLDTDPCSIEQVEFAQKEVGSLTWELIQDDHTVRNAIIEHHKYHLPAEVAPRSIAATRSDKSTIMTTKKLPHDVNIVQEIRLEEKACRWRYPILTTPLTEEQEDDRGFVEDAIQQIQGAFDYFQGFKDWTPEIGRAFTRICDPFLDPWCTHCNSDVHRSGDCVLPTKEQPPIVDTRPRFME